MDERSGLEHDYTRKAVDETFTARGRRVGADTRIHISSVPLDIGKIADAIRGHWGVEAVHWSLDVIFNEDLSRYRARNGAKNMAVIRRFAFNLLKQATYQTGKRPGSKATASMNSKRKIASWSHDFLLQVLNVNAN